MEVAKLSAPPNLEVRYDESAIKRCLSSEPEEAVFSLTHELFMTQHTKVLKYRAFGRLWSFNSCTYTLYCMSSIMKPESYFLEEALGK